MYGQEERESVSLECVDCGYTSTEDWTATGSGCPQCGSIDPPKETKTKQQVPVLASVEDRPKTRVKVDVFGALHFKVSYYARNQAECSYFGLFLDKGKDVACETYPDLYDEIQGSSLENLDRFSRAAYVYPTQEEIDKKNLVSVNKWWLRPTAILFGKRTNTSENAFLKSSLMAAKWYSLASKRFMQRARQT